MKHGARHAYANRGCRCNECREAQRVYMLEYQRQRSAGLTEDEREERNRKQREMRSRQRAGRVAAGLSANAWDDARKAADARRRAARSGADVERFANAEIYERDNWACGICEQAVDRSLAYPDPMSVSLDHIIPLSLGGSHTRDNVRCSHLTCNVRRGNRVA